MKPIIIIISVLIFAGCHKSNQSEIAKIELAKGECMGSCILEAISIDSSLNYKFYADSSFTWNKVKPKKVKVNYTGKASRELWDNLVEVLENANYKNADTIKQYEIADIQHIELIVYWGRNKTRITAENKGIDKVISLLDSSYTHIKLSPTKKKLSFGTKMQIPLDLNHTK